MKQHIFTFIAASLFSIGMWAQETDYPIAFPESQVSKKSDKGITGMRFETTHGTQSFYPEGGTNYIYRRMLTSILNVTPGEQVTATIQYASKWSKEGLWMNGYVYLDKDNDGLFDVPLDEITIDNPLPECDLLTYSYIETVENKSGFNSRGEAVSGDDRDDISMPAFTIPATLAPGMYRMRVKMDWGSADPAGRMTETNSIVANGGQIIDLLVNVHGDKGVLTQEGEHGTITFDESGVPFGEAVTVVQQPDEGYVAGAVTVRYGHNLQGEAMLHSNPQWYELTLPAAATVEGHLTIPADYAIADMHLISHFVEEGTHVKGDYPCNFDKDGLMVTKTDRAISSITFTSADGQGTVSGWSVTAPFPVYADATDQVVCFKAGETVTPTCNTKSAEWMHAYVYIDYDNSGYFEIADAYSELVTSTSGSLSYSSIPSFTLPKWLPDGDYRVRFKTDWDCNDPGGRYGENYTDNFINANRGQIIDFTLRIDGSLTKAALREETEHCNLYMADGVSQLPTTIRGQESITFCVKPMENYVLDGTLDVVSDAGTVSFSEIPDDGILTAAIDGNTLIRAHFKQGPQATWHCIFNDEFNKDNYTWNTKDWTTRERSGATWARFNSTDPKDSVVVQNNGYVSLTTKTIGKNEMRTGNLISQYRHDFTYGRVEARCKVYPHNGNFPAFWMMPTAQKPNYSGDGGTWGGWPHSGEIDIMEQINWENKAYHTIHSHWANGAGEGGLGQTYQKGGSCWVDMYDKWHVYTLEWDKEQLRWYVDGKHTHTYDRIPSKDNDSDRQWPYDRPFYVIINQSVGNGSWAAAPDYDFQYRMDVDYVRVYQRCVPDAINDVIAQNSVDVRAGEGRIIITTLCETPVTVVSLSGAQIFNGSINGTSSVPVTPGLYIAAGKKVVVK